MFGHCEHHLGNQLQATKTRLFKVHCTVTVTVPCAVVLPEVPVTVTV
jgi:hypothetical protein